jgi:hypothetical protein
MGCSEKSIQLSRRIYAALLEEDPLRGKTMTYREIGDRVGVHWRALPPALKKIQAECAARNWPTITVLIVYTDTRRPGAGCNAHSEADFRATVDEIRWVNWPKAAWW